MFSAKPPYALTERSNARVLILFLVAAMLAASASFAASGGKYAELLKKAACELDDELYDVAEQDIRKYLSLAGAGKAPSTEAVIMLARALHGLKRYPEMLALLTLNQTASQNSPQADQFAFWLAVANYENNRLPLVIEQTAAFENRYPNSLLMNDNLRVRVKTLLKLNRGAEAAIILQKMINTPADQASAANDSLALAQMLVETGKIAEAYAILEKLLSYPAESSVGQQCRLILGQAYFRDKNLKKARAAYESLLKQNNVPPAYRLQAVESLSAISAAQTNLAEAFALLENESLTMFDAAQKNELDLHKGRLLLRMNRTDDGVVLIHNYVNAQTNLHAGAKIQFELAQMLLQNGLPEKALAEFQTFLETFAAQPESGSAYCGKGDALYRLGRYQEAASAYSRAEELAKETAEKNQYRYRAAMALFANAQYQAAAEIYSKIADTTEDAGLNRLARLQTAECLLQTGNAAAAERELWSLYDEDPADLLSSGALLRLAESYLQRNLPRGAETIYSMLNVEYGGRLEARARLGLGMIAYRAGRYDDALKYSDQALKLASDGEVAADAAFQSGWALARLSKWEEACRKFSLVVDSYGSSAKAPESLFWLGEFAYNSRLFYRAEAYFRLLADKYPGAAQAADALFWAGRAALNQNEFRRARDYFSSLLKKYPASSLRPESRYFQGIALCELGQFDAAILVFNEIIKQYPDHHLFESAILKKADCFFMLGSEDPKRYNEAFETYQLIIDQPDRTQAARLQARYKMGRCLEKTERINDAFSQYMQVVYAYLQSEEQTPAENIWFSRAAFNAAGIMEERQSWHKAANIYERVVEADIPASLDAAERIDKLRKDHWLAFY